MKTVDKKEIAVKVTEEFKKLFPDAVCSLNYSNPLELIIATRLSAQCTDARVNTVTPPMFARYKTLDDYAEADVKDIENYIHSCGFYRQKAKDIIGIARMIRDDYGGVMPDTVEELTRLPGVGRKTANLVCGDVYGKPAVVADTHFIRICNRLGFADTKDPVKVEYIMRDILPPEESSDFCHRCVLFGRSVCQARNPHCEECPVSDLCKYYCK